MPTVTTEAPDEKAALPVRGLLDEISQPCKEYFATLTSAPECRWNSTTVIALLALILIWIVKLYTTWAKWGDVTIDSGHEMYVPSLLAHGKLLYRDVWFPYTPVAPYFTSWLFRLFGERLEVLYLAGAFSALGSAVFLYLAGKRLGFWAAGWMAGAVLLLEAFQPSLFCFPLPYSSSAVYGCLVASIFVWLSVSASSTNGHSRIFAAGTVAAVALLLKIEFGAACYATLALLLVGRALRMRSLKSFSTDIFAILPGVLLCVVVVRWMVSIAGAEFITQENIMSWPTSYFMRNYGKLWLGNTGFSLTYDAFVGSAYRALMFVTVWQGLLLVSVRNWTSARLAYVRVLLAAVAFAMVLSAATLRATLLALFFPQDLVLYGAIGAAFSCIYLLLKPQLPERLAVAVVLVFSSLLAFRILLNCSPEGYSIYYNAPAALSLFLLAAALFSRVRRRWPFLFRSDVLVCALCLLTVILETRGIGFFADTYVSWKTDRGLIKMLPYKAVRYQHAVDFMKEKYAAGEPVLSVPEDTSLYFLAGVPCPTRVYLFAPGVLAPGKMVDEVINEIEQKRVHYLLWSNRMFVDFGAPRFGVDFDQRLGQYLRDNYERIGSIATEPVNKGEWVAFVWERKRDKIFK